MLIESAGYLVLAVVFGVSGISKLRRPAAFAADLAGYEILPRVMARPVAIAATAAEIGCAALLIPPGTRLAGLLVAGGLIAAFIAAMSSALIRGQRIPCGCFGGRGELDAVGLPSLLRTVLLAVIVITSLAGRAATFRPVQVLVAALLLALIFLLAEIARLLPGRPAGAVR
jgi:hypothetical protein